MGNMNQSRLLNMSEREAALQAKLDGLEVMVSKVYYELTDGAFSSPYTDPVFIIDKVNEIYETDKKVPGFVID